MARMKKRKSGKRTSTGKGKGAAKSVEEYLARVPQPARRTLNKVRAAIKHEGVLVWYAAFADHCSLFPTAAVIEKFKKELKGFAKSKGTIQFPTDKPLPAGLVKKMVKARVAQIEKKRP